MVSLPSGSREDVELVQIETAELSLILKGKPYHHRYEGLKQYQKMDHHDVMEFSVNGTEIQEIKVYDINRQKLVDPGHFRPIFFENGVYQLIVVPKRDKEFHFYHENPLLRQAVSPAKIGRQTILMGNLQYQNEVGYSTFEIRSADQTVLEVTIEIFPSKLDYKNDYKKLLDEVNDEIYNLAYHFIRKTYLGAQLKLEGTPSKSEFYRLISLHFNHFVQAIARIEQQPHHKLEKRYEKARGDQLRKLDAHSRNFLRKRASLFVEVERGIPVEERNLLPVEGLRSKKELTYDTNENRFVKWMTERLIHKLTDLLQSVLTMNKRSFDEPDPDLVARIQGMIRKLDSRMKNFFWSRIGKTNRSVMSLVLQMAPGYRDAFQIYLTVSKGLILQGKLYQMSVKDVATLYEYWTFLKLGQILGRKYTMVSPDISVQVNREGLFVNLAANQTAERKYRHPVTGEEIVLTYQKYEGSLPTVPQQPDSMLSIEKKGKDYTFNYIFDAKYRIDYAQDGSSYQKRYHGPGPLEDDINTMHRYRDSIVAERHGPYERTSFGAYVLFPFWDEHAYQDHHFYKSIDKVNIGGLPFLPSATTIVERFIERLIDKSPEEIQQEGILPRGTLAEWKSSLDEFVLVGLVSTQAEYQSFIKEGYYQLPSAKLKQGWQKAHYVALYVNSNVQKDNGVVVYGEIRDVLPVKVEGADYIRFTIDSWVNTPSIIKPVRYGIVNYMMTTLSALKEAKELPELYMKSHEETVIWRMLRRVSDRIKIDLDDMMLDEAGQVKEYRIKDIAMKIFHGEKKILFQKREMVKEMDLADLARNPTRGFRILMELMMRFS